MSIVRTVGIVPKARLRHAVRAKAKIGLQNLVYNMRRLVTVEQMAAA